MVSRPQLINVANHHASHARQVGRASRRNGEIAKGVKAMGASCVAVAASPFWQLQSRVR